MRTRLLVDERQDMTYKVAARYIEYGRDYWANQPYYTAVKRCRSIAMVDVVTKNFKSRRQQGEIVNNPMWKVSYQRFVRLSNVIGTTDGISKPTLFELNHLPVAGFYYEKYSTPNKAVDAFCAAFSSDSQIAQTKAWANIDVSEMQTWASLGELPETIRMIVDLLKQALKLTIAAKRGDVKTLVREVKKLRSFDTYADAWLMWRYGVRPLIGEITSLLKILESKPIIGKRQTFRGKHVIEVPDTITMIHVPWSQGGAGWDYRKRERLTGVFRAGVLVQIENSINSGLAMLGLDNPLEAIWELTPMSFILDWFVNVGDVINAIIGNPSLSPVCSYVTEEITQTTLMDCVGHSQNGDTNITQVYCFSNNTIAVDPGYCNTFITARRRVPLAERYALPRLRVSLSLAKLTDLALIARKL